MHLPSVAGCWARSLGFALRDSAAAPKAGAARTRGFTLACVASRIRETTAAPSDPDGDELSRPSCKRDSLFSGAGELPKVVKWLRKGGAVDAFRFTTTCTGQPTTTTLPHTAAVNDHLEMVRELLKRGASVDLQNSLGGTALMSAASYDHLSIVLVLLQHSANPDLQDNDGDTALMAYCEDEASVKALLRAKANPDLQSNIGITALMWLLRPTATSPACSFCCSTWPTPTCSPARAALP